MQNTDKRETIYNALKQRSEHMSQTQLANMMPKVSTATINQILNRKWDDISGKMWNRIGAFLKIDDWTMIETANYNTIMELCRDAQEESRFIGIPAHSGFGKTEALNMYVRKNPNVFYLMGDILMSGKVPFLLAVQRALGISNGRAGRDMLLAITERLNELDSPLLIIDDAGKLNDSCLRLIQLIYDHTVRRCGIIIAGTEVLKANLEKGRRLNKMGYEEICRRIELWQKLEPPTGDEIEAICIANGLTENKIIEKVKRGATNFGDIRNMVNNALKLERKNLLTVENFVHTSKAFN